MESTSKPRLREQVRTVMRLHHYSIRTEKLAASSLGTQKDLTSWRLGLISGKLISRLSAKPLNIGQHRTLKTRQKVTFRQLYLRFLP